MTTMLASLRGEDALRPLLSVAGGIRQKHGVFTKRTETGLCIATAVAKASEWHEVILDAADLSIHAAILFFYLRERVLAVIPRGLPRICRVRWGAAAVARENASSHRGFSFGRREAG